MYKAFFHLENNPFDLTPNPACFVPTKRHNEALASLYYGVRRHKGFVVVTGEVGTGKTLLLRCLLQLLEDSKDIGYAYVFTYRLSATEFLQYAMSDFGLSASGKNKGELLFELSQFLIALAPLKKVTTTVLVSGGRGPRPIQGRAGGNTLLSNLETRDDKLLQILLVGAA